MKIKITATAIVDSKAYSYPEDKILEIFKENNGEVAFEEMTEAVGNAWPGSDLTVEEVKE